MVAVPSSSRSSALDLVHYPSHARVLLNKVKKFVDEIVIPSEPVTWNVVISSINYVLCVPSIHSSVGVAYMNKKFSSV